MSRQNTWRLQNGHHYRYEDILIEGAVVQMQVLEGLNPHNGLQLFNKAFFGILRFLLRRQQLVVRQVDLLK